jgi:hypothetical protein
MTADTTQPLLAAERSTSPRKALRLGFNTRVSFNSGPGGALRGRGTAPPADHRDDPPFGRGAGTSERSWETNRYVSPRSLCRRKSRSMMPACTVTSSAEVGSSRTTTSGRAGVLRAGGCRDNYLPARPRRGHP